MNWLQLMSILATVVLSHGQANFYVTNSSEIILPNGSCHFKGKHLHPCVTIETLASKVRSLIQSNETIIYFFCQHYILQNSLNISLMDSTTVEMRPWSNQGKTVISCREQQLLVYTNVHKVAIKDLTIHQCANFQLLVNDTSQNHTTTKLIIENSLFLQSSVQILCHTATGILAVTVVNCQFYESSENSALQVDSSSLLNGIISNTSFIKNKNGSLLLYSPATTGTLWLSGCKFLGNGATSEVGHVVFLNTLQSVYIAECIFTNNTEAGALWVGFKNGSDIVSSLQMYHSVFINNTASYGGAVKIDHHVKFYFLNCTFKSNSAVYRGGAIFFSFSRKRQPLPQKKTFILNCSFSHNSANETGGAIHATAPNNGMKIQRFELLVKNSSFTSNSARHGGSIYIYLFHKVTIQSTVFFDNKASYGGGAVCADNTALVIYECKLQRNSAESYGGALTVSTVVLLINNSMFIQNTATQGSGLKAELAFNGKFQIVSSIFRDNHATGRGGALTLLARYPIILSHCSFSNNTAKYGGAIAFIMTTIPRKIQLNLTHCQFTANRAVKGGAIALLSCYNVTFENSSFLRNRAEMDGGAVYINEIVTHYSYRPCKVSFSVCTFINNSALHGGGIADYGPIKNSNVMIRQSIFINNIATRFISEGRYSLTNCHQAIDLSTRPQPRSMGGAIAVKTSHSVRITNSSFRENKAHFGGVIYSMVTKVDLHNSDFISNSACDGGAIFISRSHFVLRNVKVGRNRAFERGGGIFSKSSSLKLKNSVKFSNNNVQSRQGMGGAICLKYEERDCTTNSCPLLWTNATRLDFTGNWASLGSILFGGMLDWCNNIIREKHATLTSLLHVNGSNYSVQSRGITSEGVKFCYCFNSQPKCNERNISVDVYPGQVTQLFASCIDQLGQPVSCVVKGEYDSLHLELGRGENSRLITKCQPLTFHSFAEEHAQGILNLVGTILCTQSKWSTLKVQVGVTACPVGFQSAEQKCICDRRLQDEFSKVACNLTSRSIAIHQSGWFSYDSALLRVSGSCPLNYCSNQEDISIHFPYSQCKRNRGGVLCGGCLANYSVVLGSWKCMECSHMARYNFVWLTVVMALAGVALIVFLLLVKMTVSSGTINGLIFYANVVSLSGLLDHPVCAVHPFLRVFLSWINLDLGVEVCFYSGMNVYQKTWLQFVFPFYIWFLVGVIILVCHYSVAATKLMGRRSIEVLATLFLLSYTKILKTIATALSYTSIKIGSTSDFSDPLTRESVWVYDGNLRYLSQKHLILFMTSLFVLLCFFVPYTILLLLGQCLKYCPERKGLKWMHSIFLTAIMDAYHAPYTRHHRYWTGLSLLFRCALLPLFCISYSLKDNLFWTSLAVFLFFAIRVLCGKIYKTVFANIMEILFLLNMSVLVSVLLYNGSSCNVLSASISLSLLGFVVLLGYHIYQALKARHSSIKIISENLMKSLSSFSLSAPAPAMEDDDKREVSANQHTVSYIELQ